MEDNKERRRASNLLVVKVNMKLRGDVDGQSMLYNIMPFIYRISAYSLRSLGSNFLPPLPLRLPPNRALTFFLANLIAQFRRWGFSVFAVRVPLPCRQQALNLIITHDTSWHWLSILVFAEFHFEHNGATLTHIFLNNHIYQGTVEYKASHIVGCSFLQTYFWLYPQRTIQCCIHCNSISIEVLM